MDNQIKKKILLVEDDATLSEMYQKKFSVEGFNILAASTGGEGFQLALQTRPDLILLDILLPGMDGMTVLKKLRDDPWGKDVPIIMLTNLNADDNILKGVIESRPAYYLMKSNSDPSGVVEKVKELLK
ncbi:MAG TPA: response regulator [Candidatus Limnocylindrales bacterium]|nr:response regulator [Candidatus Limnocylindrales bacterium]